MADANFNDKQKLDFEKLITDDFDDDFVRLTNNEIVDFMKQHKPELDALARQRAEEEATALRYAENVRLGGATVPRLCGFPYYSDDVSCAPKTRKKEREL